ncbi:MAG: hypothetical protein IH984_12450 [Planctomycetes bacterium]|nr:hypothetical protein [Planctomycetota bacterium]
MLCNYQVVNRVFVVVAISFCLISRTVPAAADILHVPGDYLTIQEAIDAAMEGDEVVVAPGTYFENIDLHSDAISVSSSGGPDVTTIDAGGNGTVVSCIRGEGNPPCSIILDGFTITGGNSGGMVNQGSSPTVMNCIFLGNSANFGGGMQNNGQSPTVMNCLFLDNSAEFGGGMGNLGSSPTVINCTFSGNTATDSGGGMQNNGEGPGAGTMVINCTFSGNTATNNGGGIHNGFSNPTVTNCILWGDSPDEIFDSNSSPSVTFSNVMGGYAGDGNIDADPRFFEDDMQLDRFSPCTDAGDNTASGLIGITEDLDGNPRFVDDAGVADSGMGAPPIIDMGAYERQTVSVNLTIKLTIVDSIQETIDFALDGDEIVLNTGNYNQTINLLGKAITLRSTDPNDPAVVAATILDGTGLETTVITCDSGESTDTVIDGLTITGGNAINGGGMSNFSSSPTVTNCSFIGNISSFGGGIGNHDASSPMVAFCTFSENSASFGGGMVNFNDSNPAVIDCAFSGNTGVGGGIFNLGSDPTVTNSIFNGNTASRGGGMANDFSSNPTVTDCTFSNNTASDLGGGMINIGSSPTVTNCTFINNSASSRGGGMSNTDNSSPTVTDCAFTGNSAGYGGGMSNQVTSEPEVINCTFEGNMAFKGGGMINDTGSPIVTNCTFSGNTVTGTGGGMGNDFSTPMVIDCTFNLNTANENAGGGMANNNSNSTLINCIFIENTALSGGGMVNSQCNPTMTNCSFIGNLATFGGGGMANYSFSDPIMTNCTFRGNVAAEEGGGIFNQFVSNPIVTNCTFSGNFASFGGGMGNISSSPNVTNCTFEGNLAVIDNGGAMYNSFSAFPTVNNSIFWFNTGGEIVDHDTAVTVVRFSNVSGGFVGEGNVDADPMFVDADGPDDIPGTDDDNLRLLPGSPCTDAADNTAVPGGITQDLDGNPRFVDDPDTIDTGFGDPPIVDMGAYEFQLPPPNSDPDNPEPVESGETILGDFDYATSDGTSSCDPNSVDLFYEVVITTGPATLEIDTCGSAADSALAIFDSSMMEIGCNTDCAGQPCGVPDACLSIPGLPADTYLIRVSQQTNSPAPGSPTAIMLTVFLETCPWDLDDDGTVNTSDLLALFAQWGTDGSADFDGSGLVNTTDLLILFANWGPCP